MVDLKNQKLTLNELKKEHEDLDSVIQKLSMNTSLDQLKLQRLKKRKLLLKDQIYALENGILPDIIA